MIVPATTEHIVAIACHVRPDDRAELWAMACMDPTQGLEVSLRNSDLAWTGFIDGEPVCMFGVAPGSILSDTGQAWMIGTEALDRHPIAFLRRCRPCVDMMLEQYSTLVNYVDQRNARAVAWLRWLGFSIGEPEPLGPYGMPFLRFEMRRTV